MECAGLDGALAPGRWVFVLGVWPVARPSHSGSGAPALQRAKASVLGPSQEKSRTVLGWSASAGVGHGQASCPWHPGTRLPYTNGKLL